jgi:hypothetical protein
MRTSTAVLTVGLVLGFALTAQAGEKWRFSDGHWRVEGTGSWSIESGGDGDRAGDWVFNASIEYEWPVLSRATMGLRLYPLYLYMEHNNGRGGSETIYGAAVSVTGRIYQNAEELDGFYGELGLGILGLTKKIEDNSGNFQALIVIGGGYQFPESDWNIGVSLQHISSAYLSDKNSGTNMVAASVGYRF